nr:hypothetical protein [Tanacetum cinerariifolium]
MLKKSMYHSWASRIRLFIKGKKHGRMMLDSIDNGPLVYPTVEENGQTRLKKYSELTKEQKLQNDCDVQATNIILHGLPPDVYALVNHQEAAKAIWDNVKLLIKGAELSYQESKCRLYNLFDKFAFVQGETLYKYYWRFSLLINDMHTIGMTMQQVQVNTKFLNALLPEWSKFVTNVKLAKSLYTTTYDQLYAYLSQHERHANAEHILRERYLDPLALVANSQTLYNPTIGMTMQQVQVNTKFLNALLPEWSKFVTNVKLAKSLYTTTYDQLYAYLSQHERYANAEHILHERYLDPLALVANSQTLYNPSQSPQHSVPTMHPPPQQFTPLDSGLAVPMFQQGEDPIECVNKAMEFLSAVALRFPPSNNQFRTSFNLRNQATIQDGRVTVQQIHGRQTQSFVGTRNNENATNLRGINAAGQPRTKDLDAYDSNCDDLSSAKAVLMANLSSCDSDVLSEVPYSDSYPDDMLNQDVQEMTQNELDAEQAFWLKHSNHPSVTLVVPHTPVKVEAPCELPKVSLVNKSLKKLKYQLANFDKVVKNITTSDVITAALKNELRKLKGKNVVDTAVSKPSVTTIAPRMFKLNLEPLAPKLLQNKDFHMDYIKHSRDHANILQEIVENARALSPLDSNLDSACKYV